VDLTAAIVQRPSRVRYRVVAMAFALGLVLYLDRAALSVLAPAMRRNLKIGPMAMGWIFSAFVLGYALFHIPSGWMGDRFGARRVLTAIVVLWSLFTALTASAWNLGSLLVIRFLFGAAEAGASPNISRAFAQWIPFSERASAQGIFFAGMSGGGALAPPLVTLCLLRWGWRVAFLVLGALGLMWAVRWFLWYRDNPADHAAVNAAELELLPCADAAAGSAPVRWRDVLATPNLWAILLMYFSYGYTGYIYITWFPGYLIEERHLTPLLSGLLAGMPSLLGVFAKPLGGWWSDRLAARRGIVFGRRAVGMCGFGLGGLAVLPGLLTPNPYAAVLLFAIADAGAALAHGVCFAVCLDVGLKRAGTISALMLTMGSLGNAASALAFGASLQWAGSWNAPFLIGMTANLAGALLWLKIHPDRKLL
jgi:MFS family permease